MTSETHPFRFGPLEAFDLSDKPRPEGVLVYASLCLSNGGLYFGITTQTFRRRVKKHINSASRGSNCLFHRALREHGPQQFVWCEVGYWPTWADACRVEVSLIHRFGTQTVARGYNTTSGGSGSVGVSPSEASRQRISNTLKAWHRSDDPRAAALRAKISAVRKNTPTSSVTRAKMAEAHTGRTLSEGSRAKLSASLRRYPEETVSEVTTFALSFGFRAAARKYGIPHKTVRRWTLSPEQLEEDRRKMRERGRERPLQADSANLLVTAST